MNAGMFSHPPGSFPAAAQKYARVEMLAAEGTEGGSITAGVWNPRALSTISDDDYGIIPKTLADGTVIVVPGRYRVRAFAQMTQLENAAGRIIDMQSLAVLASATMFSGTGGRLSSTLILIDDVIDIRAERGIRFDLYSAGTNGAGWATGLAYDSGTTGEQECHAVLELWEELDA